MGQCSPARSEKQTGSAKPFNAWKFEWGGTAGHAHSVIAQTLATQGVVGLLALLGAVFIVVRKARPSAEFAVVLALAAASMVAFSGVLVAALGVCALARVSPSPREAGRGSGRGAEPWLPIPLVVLTAVTLMMFGASIAARVLPLEPVAERLEPWNAQWPALRGEALERSERLAEALTAYERARELAPLGAFEANVGRVASKLGDALRSRAAFESARRLAPLDGRVALEAAEASVRLNELTLAEGTLVSLVTLYPTDAPAWFTLGKVRLLEGKGVEARAALEQSLASDWRDWPEGMGVARDEARETVAKSGALPIDLVSLDALIRQPELVALDREVAQSLTRDVSEVPFLPGYLVNVLRLAGLVTTRDVVNAVAQHGPSVKSALPKYFEFARRSLNFSPETIVQVQRGYALLFVALLSVIRGDERKAQRIASELVGALS